ncbi:DUF397 domain-containing protein [Actinorugispora endophytica]|uniref:Uncharacterized protein DUF397 n=1 Tax=Actinorugispora endophytica TaxID=1605990 RepID=A0A4V3D9E0_9ACTN|nr:DUF397 domain-containing protein [Actinorugispora endophytica]TDQ55230.1 uncharacterized protein DUF397 [Actinorugispora endophytica]
MRASHLTWFKSSYSGTSSNCVEVAHVPTGFRTSSYRQGRSQNCVEVADTPGASAVRDTRNRHLGALLFDSAEWRAFLSATKHDTL